MSEIHGQLRNLEQMERQSILRIGRIVFTACFLGSTGWLVALQLQIKYTNSGDDGWMFGAEVEIGWVTPKATRPM